MWQADTHTSLAAGEVQDRAGRPRRGADQDPYAPSAASPGRHFSTRLAHGRVAFLLLAGGHRGIREDQAGHLTAPPRPGSARPEYARPAPPTLRRRSAARRHRARPQAGSGPRRRHRRSRRRGHVDRDARGQVCPGQAGTRPVYGRGLPTDPARPRARPPHGSRLCTGAASGRDARLGAARAAARAATRASASSAITSAASPPPAIRTREAPPPSLMPTRRQGPAPAIAGHSSRGESGRSPMPSSSRASRTRW
jgi:hypothetical protein